MQLEKGLNTNIYRLTLNGHELAAMVASVEIVTEGTIEEVSSEEINNLRLLLVKYNNAIRYSEVSVPNHNSTVKEYDKPEEPHVNL